MIPLADDNPALTRPYVVYALIALNALVYIAQVLHAFPEQQFAMIPYSVLHNVRVWPVFNQVGQVVGQQGIPTLVQPQWITIFTSMFMHGGFLHIAGNMLFLWVFGNNIEDTLGHVKFLFFYLACGVAAAFAHIYSNPASFIPTVGASGAIAGVLGAYLILYPGARVKTLIMLFFYWDFAEVPAVYVLGVWFILQLIQGAFGGGGLQGGGVAYWAHVGGFVAGLILVLILGGKRLADRRRQRSLSRYDEDRF